MEGEKGRARVCVSECVRVPSSVSGVFSSKTGCARAPTERIKKKFTVWICRGRTCVPGFCPCFPLIFETSASLPSIETRANYWQTGAGRGRGDESNDKIAFFANESCVKGRYGDNGFRGLISLSV